MSAPTFFNWQPEALYERLQVLAPGLGFGPVLVEAVAETGSTNTDLLNQAKRGDASAVVRVATTQTAGRGRRGRDWVSAHSQPGGSLAFSIGLPIDLTEQSGQRWSGLSLAVGVALADALEAVCQAQGLQLKWPNDLWWQGRKLSGILIESAQGYAVVGVGINIAAHPALPVAEFSTGYASLSELSPQQSVPMLAAQAWHAAALAVLQAAAQLRDQGFGTGFAARFAARDALRGQQVRVSGPPTLDGTACGVSDEGALLVHTAEGMKTVHSSDVSVRPAAPSSKHLNG